MLTPLFNGPGVEGNLDNYTGVEDFYDPRTVSRPPEVTDPVEIRQTIEDFADRCFTIFGTLPLYSGDYLNIYDGVNDYDPYLTPNDLDIDRDVIFDGKIGGGLTELIKVNGKDYLDIDFYYERSGCLGDLFGYSVDLTDGKLVVGTPFNAYYTETDPSGIVDWSDVGEYYTQTGDPSGVKIAEDGGGGAAFVFHKTNQGSNVVEENLPWELEAKIKPDSANEGVTQWGISGGTDVDDLIYFKGPTTGIGESIAKRYGSRSDNFGLSVSIDCDMIAVGSPNHDFDTLHHYIYNGNSAFLRKAFDSAFDIPLHSFYDLGSSGVRIDQFNNNSGQFILNIGAVYNYRYEMTDIPARTQEWIFAQKLVPEGFKSFVEAEYDGIPTPGDFYGTLTASGSELDSFGRSVSIDRAYRGDADYTVIVGSPLHDFATSGDHATQDLTYAGAGYTFDAMLRGQPGAIPNSTGWMDVRLFGEQKDNGFFTRIQQNETGGSLTYQLTGILNANDNGDVILEVSGYDPSAVGFIAHRPYVESVSLSLRPASGLNSSVNLSVTGGANPQSGQMPLVLLGADTANVYNNMNLYSFGVIDSGVESMNLFAKAVEGEENETLNLFVTSTTASGDLSLKIRGY
jgi:hypothetical protein